MFSDH